MASAVLEAPRGQDHREGAPMVTTSVPKRERLWTARTLDLKEAEDRYNHELLDDEEKLLLLARIKRLRRQLENRA